MIFQHAGVHAGLYPDVFDPCQISSRLVKAFGGYGYTGA